MKEVIELTGSMVILGLCRSVRESAIEVKAKECEKIHAQGVDNFQNT